MNDVYLWNRDQVTYTQFTLARSQCNTPTTRWCNGDNVKVRCRESYALLHRTIDLCVVCKKMSSNVNTTFLGIITMGANIFFLHTCKCIRSIFPSSVERGSCRQYERGAGAVGQNVKHTYWKFENLVFQCNISVHKYSHMEIHFKHKKTEKILCVKCISMCEYC